ncbi:tRNA (adenosine(37)-N6)-dimethylallyltransferase MiaA [Helicobacter sp. 23-1045]
MTKKFHAIPAIIGTTASGKSALAIRLARKFDLKIFSLDSLSIYKGIDIASAKPSVAELREICHYGINVLNPSEKCNAGIFLKLLCEVLERENPQKLLIVGGSSFYLKSIIDGLSIAPKVSEIAERFIAKMSQNRAKSYALLREIDRDFADKISPNDRFRIAKGLQIYFATRQAPSAFFAQNPRQKLPCEIKIFELIKAREILRDDIQTRTERMFRAGLVSEVRSLRDNFSHSQALKAIGIKEILPFLDGKITQDEAKCAIIKNTLALAKRQRTFNRTQFGKIPHLDESTLESTLIKQYESLG